MALLFREILKNINDPREVSKLCQLDKQHHALCGDENFWRQEIKVRYGDMFLSTDKEQYLNLLSYERVIDELMTNGKFRIPLESYEIREKFGRIIEDPGNLIHIKANNKSKIFEVDDTPVSERDLHDVLLLALLNNIRIYDIDTGEAIRYYRDRYNKDIDKIIDDMKSNTVSIRNAVSISFCALRISDILWGIIDPDNNYEHFDILNLYIIYDDAQGFTIDLVDSNEHVEQNYSENIKEDDVKKILLESLINDINILDGGGFIYVQG